MIYPKFLSKFRPGTKFEVFGKVYTATTYPYLEKIETNKNNIYYIWVVGKDSARYCIYSLDNPDYHKLIKIL